MEPAALSAQVPHLILQPVVENAIQHGIAPRARPGHIRIEAKQSNGYLHIEVEDNGSGITNETTHGLGLTNVRARLTQIYGTASRLEMTNGPQGGLTVIMDLPFQPVAS